MPETTTQYHFVGIDLDEFVRHLNGFATESARAEEAASATESANAASEPTEEPETYTCPRCGREHDGSGPDTPGGRYCSVECAEADGYRECFECSDWVDESDGIIVDGDFYCSERCAAIRGCWECDQCGEWHGRRDFGLEIGDHRFCNRVCAQDADFYECDRCGEWTHDDYLRTVQRDGYSEEWCESCCYDTSCCERCGDLVYDDDMIRVDGDWLCPRCAQHVGYSEHLHQYGYTPELRFFGTALGTPLYLGVELETDGGSDRGNYCDDLMEIEGFAERFWMTEDSSLDNGVEITSHPITLHEHAMMEGLYDSIGRTASEYGFRSHDGGRCGLHIHVNRAFFGKSKYAQDAGGYKMMRLLQRFVPQFMLFSRRRDDNWCHYKTYADFSPKKVEPRIGSHPVDGGLFAKASEMVWNERQHSQALNFQHRSTFEFRIFRGTLKWTTYYACLALVDGMARTVKVHGSEWVEGVDWYSLIDEVIEHVSEDMPKACLETYLAEKGLLNAEQAAA